MAVSREDKIFWSEFIDLYRESPCLWKITTSDYSDRSKKTTAYDILAGKLKERDASATKDTVTKKINSLRSAFRKEYRKVISSQNSGVGADRIYRPSLWYYDMLLFLHDQEAPRQPVTHVQEVSESRNVYSSHNSPA